VLTPKVRSVLVTVRQETQARVAEEIAGLSEAERATIVTAMNVLKDLFSGPRLSS
jgi:DNA-binding MarR family transcriptional regulator